MTDKELSQQAKDYFAQIRKTDRLIQRLKGTVATLRSGLTSQSYELKPDKVQSSGAKNPLESTMIKILDLERQITARIDELATMRNDTFSMIKNVPDLDQQNILIGRYIQLKEWDDIAAELSFSPKWVLKLHGKALLEFYKGNQEFFEKRLKATCEG
ncbi:hypothetical protein D1641_04160 [Colidextribacter sp. OB.20]|uniref:hypothetical protein n=1 Tax=Colidextribacter sp. OB.20 TaxID=2304568 RepID=UPI00136D77DA|nr:hypothetical protein [Colidextribacter sp. OB.20]NBI09213.1 hypothetical protein [Colidextribacter sp. OB.20]